METIKHLKKYYLTYIQESIGKAELVKMTKIGNIHGSCRFLRVGTLTYWC